MSIHLIPPLSHLHRRFHSVATPGLLLLGSIIFTALLAQADSSRATLQVRIRETKLRSQPKFWGATVADLKYSDSLTLLGNDSGWLKVRTTGGKQGFVHPSVVTDKRIVLSSKAAVDTRTDASEVVLAGKGFSKEIEQEYAKNNPELNFKAVTKVEQVRISDQELLAFLREGKLGQGGL